MNVLEEIELRLYRFAQQGYKSTNHVSAAKDMAAEILGLVEKHLGIEGIDE